ncbi:MAG: hypothetical protein AB2L14_06760 [Candidatus Xenobiia bacterium LiM19]
MTARAAKAAAVIIALTVLFSTCAACADENRSHLFPFSVTLARPPASESTAGPAKELTSSCLSCFNESFKIIRECGDKVWKGFGTMNVRANIVTPHYEFFFGDADAPEGYILLSVDSQIGKPIYYKKREYRREFVSTIAPVAGRPALFISSKEVFEKTYSHSPLYRIAEDYIFTVVGQCFQLYLRTKNTVYTEKITALLPELENLEKKYPYRDVVNSKILKLEGEQLLEAYQTKDPDITRECILTMLRFRQMRLREMQDTCGINFTPYENWMEWSLGLSKYTEVQCARSIISGNYKSTAGMAQVSNFKRYGFLKNKIHFELGRLNSTRNSLIHAALGMTEALVLDRISSDWKEAIFRHDSSLIDILREAFPVKDGARPIEYK